jgi:hypothetical protein
VVKLCLKDLQYKEESSVSLADVPAMDNGYTSSKKGCARRTFPAHCGLTVAARNNAIGLTLNVGRLKTPPFA